MKLNDPPAVGVPDSDPFAASVTPAGSAPEVTANEYAAVPPLAVIDSLRAVPTAPFDSDAGLTVMVGVELLIASEYARAPVYGPVPVELSVAVIVNPNDPSTVGVPLKVPFAANVRPDGNAPAVRLNAYDEVPPAAVIDWLYAEPLVPAGNDAGLTVIAGVAIVNEYARAPV